MTGTDALQLLSRGDREIVMTRAFKAPREMVFDAWTEPELVKRWLGTSDWPMAQCEIDLRVGGAIRHVWRNAEGAEMGLSGIYREILRPERIVHAEQFDEDWTGGETLVTTVFAERDGRTTVTTTVLYSSQESRDAVLRSPMEQGVAEGYDRLDGVLASLGTAR